MLAFARCAWSCCLSSLWWMALLYYFMRMDGHKALGSRNKLMLLTADRVILVISHGKTEVKINSNDTIWMVSNLRIAYGICHTMAWFMKSVGVTPSLNSISVPDHAQLSHESMIYCLNAGIFSRSKSPSGSQLASSLFSRTNILVWFTNPGKRNL